MSELYDVISVALAGMATVILVGAAINELNPEPIAVQCSYELQYDNTKIKFLTVGKMEAPL